MGFEDVNWLLWNVTKCGLVDLPTFRQRGMGVEDVNWLFWDVTQCRLVDSYRRFGRGE